MKKTRKAKPSDSRLERALDEVMTTLSADSGTIHVKDPVAATLHLGASRNVPVEILEKCKTVPWGKGMAGVAAQRAAPVTYCNIVSSPSPDIHPRAKAAGVQGAIVIPMMFGHEVVGTIGIGCKGERTFTATEVAWLMKFGRSLADEMGENRMAA